MSTFRDGIAAVQLSWRQVWRNQAARAWILAYVMLNLLDLSTTYLGLRLGGGETNWLYAPLFAHFPFAVGALLKVLTATATGLLATANYAIWRAGALALMTLCTMVLTLVVAWNALLLLQLSRLL